MKTINLKGKMYAPVSARLEQFHKDHEKGTINTDTKFDEGVVIVKATVSFDDRTFTGHAYGKVGAEKAFEKLETTAVGRALAFAGYLAGGEIASYDEMQEYSQQEAIPLEDAVEKACVHVGQATSVEELTARFKSLPVALQGDDEVIAKCKEVKEQLTN